MKIKLLAATLMLGAAAFAGTCKNCGSETDDCNVYRCNKCRTFFCARCREGDRGIILFDWQPVRIVCPECSTEDTLQTDMIFHTQSMEKGNIRLIK